MSLFAIVVAAVMATATPHAGSMHSMHNSMMHSHSHMKSSAMHPNAMHSKKTTHHTMMTSTPKPG